MVYENFEKGINLLCDKFGIAIDEAAKLIPSAAKWKIAENIFPTVVLGLLIVAIAVYFYKSYKNETLFDFDNEIWNILIGFAAVFVLVFFCAGFGCIMKWILAPEIAFVEYLALLTK